MKKKTSITTLVFVYMGFFAVQVAILPASVISFIPLVITAAVGYWHTHKAHVWNTKVEWSHINRPFAVIDWGTEGGAFELPERHRGFYIACSSKNVADTLAYIQYSLSGSGNQAFIRSGLPVLEFRYRYGGAHWHETQEEYKARIERDFDEAVKAWHEKLEKDRKAYVAAFFADNQNGSAEE